MSGAGDATQRHTPGRRDFLHTGLGGLLGLAGCQRTESLAHIDGGFVGQNPQQAHRLQGAPAWPAPAATRRTHTLIIGAGVAGLAAARALRLRGVDDFAVLELEDEAGGNSRAMQLGGLSCPLGAHYLPLPDDNAPEVQDLLEELGLRQRHAGRWVYDERHLCHSPQERLFLHGQWQEGLLPLRGVGADTLQQYRRFAALVRDLQRQAPWRVPASIWPFAPVQLALSAMTFDGYLTQQGLTDHHLRWYLDYCCRDDYGAGLATVSAWAGLHYFASRHGFAAPGQDDSPGDAVLTWPEGNAWLTRRLSAPLGARLHTGRTVWRVAQTRHGAEVDAFDQAQARSERWLASQVIVALPIYVALRIVQDPPDWLRLAGAQMAYAPWLVANLHLRAPLHDAGGAAPSWDNVLYGATGNASGLGYVDASHQRLQSVPGATVLTYYRALGDWLLPPGAPRRSAGVAARHWLLQRPWTDWRAAIVAELAGAHPDLAAKTTRIALARYGHAMAVPWPGFDHQIGLQRLSVKRKQLSGSEHLVRQHGRLRFAHSDWAGYSVFEEAFTLGHLAGAGTK